MVFPQLLKRALKHRGGGKVHSRTSAATVVCATTAHCQQVNKPDPKLRVELTAVLPLSWWRSLGRVILNVGGKGSGEPEVPKGDEAKSLPR
jgi:hypothetical protein